MRVSVARNARAHKTAFVSVVFLTTHRSCFLDTTVSGPRGRHQGYSTTQLEFTMAARHPAVTPVAVQPPGGLQVAPLHTQ